jgi:hypothetical protein
MSVPSMRCRLSRSTNVRSTVAKSELIMSAARDPPASREWRGAPERQLSRRSPVMTSVVPPDASIPVAPKRDISGPLRRFRRRLVLGYQDELYRLARRLESLPHVEGERQLSEAIEAADRRRAQYESLGLALRDLVPTLQWATALRVLRDLHTQGWTFQTDDEGLLRASARHARPRWCSRLQSWRLRRSSLGVSSIGWCQRPRSPERAALSRGASRTAPLAPTPRRSECSTPGARAEWPRRMR